MKRSDRAGPTTCSVTLFILMAVISQGMTVGNIAARADQLGPTFIEVGITETIKPTSPRQTASPGGTQIPRIASPSSRQSPLNNHPPNGSVTRIVSSRSGLVESSVTGVFVSSSTRRIYLTAFAGSSAQLRAP